MALHHRWPHLPLHYFWMLDKVFVCIASDCATSCTNVFVTAMLCSCQQLELLEQHTVLLCSLVMASIRPASPMLLISKYKSLSEQPGV